MNYLFIAYYFDPYPGVGAKRISYWAKNFDISENDTKIVLTRFPEEPKSIDENFKVKRFCYDTNFKFLWLIWTIKKLFQLIKANNSIVIFTGGPFFPMALGMIVKLLKAKLILDFRDPYARNPLHRVSFLKQKIKIFYEFIICLPADKIITTSWYCGKLIATQSNKLVYIDNGFDENIISKINTRKTIQIPYSIGYAGKISQNRDLNGFLKKKSQNRHLSRFTLHYIGPDFNFINSQHNDRVKIYGLKSYEDTLKLLNQFEILLLVYGGEDFESSTKIFDYIGLNKNILVYNHKGIYQGSVINILHEYKKYSIFDEGFKGMPVGLVDNDIKKFSRLEGLNKFKRVLQNL